MICHFRCCLRLLIYNTSRTSDGSAGACLEQGQVYGMMGRIDPDCWVTVGVMFWFACFTVVFFNHDIYISRKLWCLRLTVCHFHVQNCYYLTMPRIKTIFHSIAPLSDWCVLFLDVVMNIEVVINSRHLSCWRCTGLTLLSFVRKCADPYLPKCSRESFVIELHLQKKWA